MSFPKELMETFTSSEIHFLAENEPVQVISNVHMDKVTLITTELPRLRLMSAYKIPIWLAIILRKQNKVTVTPPDWLNEKYLANKYQEEVKNPGNFSKLPAKWLEMSKIFLKNFQQDLIDEAEVILKYIQDLKEIRLVKLRKGLQNLNEVNLSFNDLSLMEINEFRPFISEVMGNLARLDRAVENPDDQEGAGEGAFAENVEDNDNEDDVGEGYSRRKDNTQYRVVLENADDVEEDDKDVPEDMEMENIMNEFEL